MALLIATVVAMVILGVKHGYTMPELEKIMTKSLEPTGLILLVTACGGVLRYMLQYSGLGDIIGQAVSSANLPIVVVAFVVAALVRICVGLRNCGYDHGGRDHRGHAGDRRPVPLISGLHHGGCCRRGHCLLPL